MSNPEIVAHRGASHDAPENTLAAFNLAFKQRADAVEGDFRLTRDGRIVCIHDETTKRVAGADFMVADSTLDQLRKLDVGSWKDQKWEGERIPTIEEVFAAIPPGKKIFVEVKCGPEIISPLGEVIFGCDIDSRQIVVISFSETVVVGVKKELSGIKAFWLTGYKKDRISGEWNPSLRQVISTLKKIKADGLESNAHKIVNNNFVKKIRREHMEFHVWTVDKPENALRFKKLGVDSITTNRPAWLRKKLIL